ncbi:hypothetical protein Verru16b_01161 [Lacunisphaera limnophila]|uniref:Lipoprotein n=1 Tax=Lacunisphaera limnophila TaxID=1838286 RepID=A0A1D8ATB1_9BACT|nr:hypothetical protein [Lacunisphaera limnophila]AOS44100.1 hypothetical protein Verru16b_01161 [Lacunisphaera limnophila]
MHPPRSPIVLLAGWLFLLAACSSPTSPNAIMDRVDANRDVYESWSIETKDAVLSGIVQKGMTPDMVYVARGKPTEKVDRGNGDEVWVYRISGGSSGGSILPRGSTVSVGTGGSGYPGGIYPGGGYPGSGYPGTYPTGGSGVYIPPIVLGGGSSGGYEEPVLEDQIIFRNGRVTHGDGVK